MSIDKVREPMTIRPKKREVRRDAGSAVLLFLAGFGLCAIILDELVLEPRARAFIHRLESLPYGGYGCLPLVLLVVLGYTIFVSQIRVRVWLSEGNQQR